MRSLLSQYWWVWLVRGVLLAVTGGLVLAYPTLGFVALLALVALGWFTSGVVGTIGSFKARKLHRHWWVMLISGLAGIAIGVLTVVYPGMSALLLAAVLAAYAFVVGATEIWTAIRLSREIRGEGWLLLSGLLAIVFGAVLATQPISGLLSLTIVIGAYALVDGIATIGTAFRVRRFARDLPAVR